jgi:hypothetical protein
MANFLFRLQPFTAYAVEPNIFFLLIQTYMLSLIFFPSLTLWTSSRHRILYSVPFFTCSLKIYVNFFRISSLLMLSVIVNHFTDCNSSNSDVWIFFSFTGTQQQQDFLDLQKVVCFFPCKWILSGHTYFEICELYYARGHVVSQSKWLKCYFCSIRLSSVTVLVLINDLPLNAITSFQSLCSACSV